MKLALLKNLLYGIYLIPLFTFFSAYSQVESQLSKYMFSGIILNPAQAGYQSAINANVFARFQWMNFEGAPNTYTFAVDGLLPNEKMGIGLHGNYEQIGLQNSFSLHASYAYQLILNELDDRLNFGISAGITQLSSKSINMQLTDINGNLIYDPTDDVILSNQPAWVPDFGVGLYYDKENFAGGLSVINMGGFFSDYKTPTGQLFLSGYIPINSISTLKPALLVKKTFDKLPVISDLHLSALFFDRFSIGMSYRFGIPIEKGLKSQHGLAFMAQVYVIEKLRIGYAYDFIMGRTALVRNGSHEVSIGYTFNRFLKRQRSPRLF